jgi:predicted HAD superfamily Cof-like phosphohydrolase
MRYRNTQQSMVGEFHDVVGAPAPSAPAPLPPDRMALRCRLIEEEAGEFRAAADAGDTYGMIDALVDLLYVTHGAAVEMGVDLEPFFEEVHRANITKAPAPDGLKAIKPAGWRPPDIEGTYHRLYGAAPDKPS